MSGLYFSKESDFKNFQKLKKEIDELEKELQKLDKTADKKKYEELEKKLKKLMVKFNNDASTAQQIALVSQSLHKIISENTRTQAQELVDLTLKADNDRTWDELNSLQNYQEKEQKQINLEEDSVQKKLKQLDLDLEKKYLGIRKEIQESIQKQQQIEREEWEKSGANDIFTPKTLTMDDLFRLNPEKSKEWEESIQVAKTSYDKSVSSILETNLTGYRGFLEGYENINNQFQEKINELKGNKPQTKEITEEIAQLEKKLEETLYASDITLKNIIDWESIFDGLDNISTETLENLKKKLTECFQGIDIKSEDFQELIQILDKKQAAISSKQPVSFLSDLKNSFKKSSDLLGKDTSKSSFLKGVLTTGSSIFGFAKKMSPIISGSVKAYKSVYKIIKSGKKVDKEHEQAKEILKAQRLEQERFYEQVLLTKDLQYEKGNTIFGSDKWGKASNAADNYQKSVKRLQDSMQKLDDIDIVNGSKKSGWGPFKKRKDVYEGILKVYPDLIDAEGNFNKERAQSIIATRKMSDENKKALQEMINNTEMVEAAYTEMESFLTDIFGNMGNSIMNTFVEAFKGSKTAMQDFSESASKMLENLIQDFIFSIRLAPLLEKASDDAMEIMSNNTLTDEQKNKQLIDITENLIDSLMDASDAVYGDLNYFQQYAKDKYDRDIFKPESSQQQASRGAYQSMSQDTGDRLEARNTAIHMTTIGIDNKLLTISDDMRSISNQMIRVSELTQQKLYHMEEIRTIQLNSYYELKDINTNTKELYEMNKRMGEMNQKLSRL